MQLMGFGCACLLRDASRARRSCCISRTQEFARFSLAFFFSYFICCFCCVLPSSSSTRQLALFDCRAASSFEGELQLCAFRFVALVVRRASPAGRYAGKQACEQTVQASAAATGTCRQPQSPASQVGERAANERGLAWPARRRRNSASPPSHSLVARQRL